MISTLCIKRFYRKGVRSLQVKRQITVFYIQNKIVMMIANILNAYTLC